MYTAIFARHIFHRRMAHGPSDQGAEETVVFDLFS
jgi:hypothetical protein